MCVEQYSSMTIGYYVDDSLHVYYSRGKFPVYMCVSVPADEDSIEGHYEAWPFGMCKKFVDLSTNPDPLKHVDTIPKVRMIDDSELLLIY